MKLPIENIDMNVFTLELIDEKMYVIHKNKRAIIIDPFVSDEMLNQIQEVGVQDVTILLTHEHFDHISGVNWLRKHFDCKVICTEACGENIQSPIQNLSQFVAVIHMNDSYEDQEKTIQKFDSDFTCQADITYDGSLSIEWEDFQITCTATPGHSEGGQCIQFQNKEKNSPAIVFTGDSFIFNQEIITRLPGGSKIDYKKITKPFLDSLDQDSLIMPGHGRWSHQ